MESSASPVAAHGLDTEATATTLRIRNDEALIPTDPSRRDEGVVLQLHHRRRGQPRRGPGLGEEDAERDLPGSGGGPPRTRCSEPRPPTGLLLAMLPAGRVGHPPRRRWLRRLRRCRGRVADPGVPSRPEGGSPPWPADGRSSPAPPIALDHLETLMRDTTTAAAEPPDRSGVDDDRLRLLFTLLPPRARPGGEVLRSPCGVVGGLEVSEVSRATPDPTETTMYQSARPGQAQRSRPPVSPVPGGLTRTSSRIGCTASWHVLHLVYTEGHVASSRCIPPGRLSLPWEAIIVRTPWSPRR